MIKIIKNEIIDDLFKNVKNTDEFLKIWEWLYMTCMQIEQDVVYIELHSLLLYLFMIKVLDYEKSINTYFNEINSLIKKIKAAVFVE